MYLTWIVSPIINIYYGAADWFGNATTGAINLGRSYLFGDFPEMVWHGFDRDWLLDECYRRMKNSPNGVGQLIAGPYSAHNWRLVTFVMGPVPIIASYGKYPLDPQSRAPFNTIEQAIKKKTLINLSGPEAVAEREKIKKYLDLSVTERVSAKTLKLIKHQMCNWQSSVDFESQISLVCTNIIARTVFGLPPVSLEDIPMLKEMSDKIVFSKPQKADFEQASRDLLALSTRIITSSIDKILDKPQYAFTQIVPEGLSREDILALPKEEQMTILQNTHGGAALIVESNLSALCAIALAKIFENLEIKKKLVNELNTLDNLSDFDALNDLPYLAAVYAEALRFVSPTAVIARQTGINTSLQRVKGNDGILRDVPVPKGSYLFASIRREHFDGEYWDNPQQFMPERFEQTGAPRFSGPHFFPFSAGARSCPAGGVFVNVVFKTLVAFVMKNYEFSLNESVEDIPVNSLHPRWSKKYYIKDLQKHSECSNDPFSASAALSSE